MPSYNFFVMEGTTPLQIKKILSDTGWSDNEILTYSKLLERGAMSLSEIAEETAISISTAKYALNQLRLKNMVTSRDKDGNPYYYARSIEKLKEWIQTIIKQHERNYLSVASFAHHYDSKPHRFGPKVKTYSGYSGIKNSYRAILKDCKDGEIYALFSVIEEIAPDLQKFFVEEYVPKRAKKGIRMKNLCLDSTKSKFYKQYDEKNLSETKLIPKELFPVINSEINLFGDTLHCMSFDEENAFAIIIKDKYLVAMLKSVFKMIWMSN